MMADESLSLPAPPPWASGERSSRANNFDAIRLVLALGVIVSHAWPLILVGTTPLAEGGEPLARLTGFQMTIGAVCVHCFFVISGYLIAASWTHSRTGVDYLRKRVLRIYPGALVAIGLSYFVGWLTSRSSGFSVRGVVVQTLHALASNAVIVHGSMPNNPIAGLVNGSVWTIQYEVGCYLLVMALGGLIVGRRAGWLMAAVVVLALTAGVWAHLNFAPLKPYPQLDLLIESIPRLVAHFLAGTTFYVYRHRIPHRTSVAALCVLINIVAAALPPSGLHFVSPFTLTYLVLWAAFHPRVRLHHFGRYGDFSFGVYLYAFPIQQSLIAYGVATTVPKNVMLAIPLALVAGMLSWHLCEKHFIHYRASGRRPDALTPSPALAAIEP